MDVPKEVLWLVVGLIVFVIVLSLIGLLHPGVVLEQLLGAFPRGG